MLRNVKLLQEQPETRSNESEFHQGQACANPCKQGRFWSKMITESDPLCSCCRGVHFPSPRGKLVIVPYAVPRE